MAGKPKRSIDFAGWRVDIFENDTKIDELIDGQGWIGFSIYFYLCQKAYASDGYFYRWSYANAATTARRMGGGIGSETIKQVVALCLRIGLFDKRLFDGEGVLTSRGIQRRYMTAIEKRSFKEVERKLWLLNDDESRGVVVVPKKPDSLPEHLNSHPEHDTKESKENKSTLQESKGNNGGSDEPESSPAKAYGEFSHVRLTDEQYHKLISDYGESTVKLYIRKIDEYCQMHGRSYNDYELTARNWIKTDNDKNNSDGKYHEDDFDINKYYSLMNKF